MNEKCEPNQNYFRVSHIITESEAFAKLSLGAKVLYYTFCKLRNRYGDERGIFFRSERTLADDAGVTKKTIQKAKKELIDARYLKWGNGDNSHACRYKLVEPE